MNSPMRLTPKKIGLRDHVVSILTAWKDIKSSWPFTAFVTAAAIATVYIWPKNRVEELVLLCTIVLVVPAMHLAWRRERESANAVRMAFVNEEQKWSEKALREGPLLDLRQSRQIGTDDPSLFLFNESNMPAKRIRLSPKNLHCTPTIDGGGYAVISLDPIEVVSAEETGGVPVYEVQTWMDLIRPRSNITIVITYEDSYGLCDFTSIFEVNRIQHTLHIDCKPPIVRRK